MSSNDNEEQIAGSVPTEGAAQTAVQDHPHPDTQIPVDDTPLDEQIAAHAAPAATPTQAPVSAAPIIPPGMTDMPSEDEADGRTGAGRKDRPVDRPELYSGYQWPTGKNPHVAGIEPVFHPMPSGMENDPFYVSALPCDVETFNSMMEAYPNINYQIGEPNREWASVIGLGSRVLMQGGFLSKAVNREGSLWQQRVPYGAKSLGAIRPRLGQDGGPGTVISGDLASMRVKQTLGLGAATNVPLWHSGFWVTLRSPSAAARLELQQRIDAEKVSLGRDTAGLAFSNVSIYLKSYLVDFALAHLSTANVRYNTPLDLKDKICSTDIPDLIWGLLTTLYPFGYPYHQPCINDPSKCQHIVKAVLDLNKICFTDTQRLTENQLKHMSDRTIRKEDLAIEAYRGEHNYNSRGLVELTTPHGKIKLQLKVPTITEYASAGFAWVDGIVNAIQQAFGSSLQGEARNTFITDRAKTLSMGEYSHWVKEIGFDDGTTINDVDTIRSTLAEISGEPELSAAFFTKVADYIEDCTLSLIALPRFNCPDCGAPSTEEEKKHPYLNPIDVEALFFTMQGQHIAKALS